MLEVVRNVASAHPGFHKPDRSAGVYHLSPPRHATTIQYQQTDLPKRNMDLQMAERAIGRAKARSERRRNGKAWNMRSLQVRVFRGCQLRRANHPQSPGGASLAKPKPSRDSSATKNPASPLRSVAAGAAGAASWAPAGRAGGKRSSAAMKFKPRKSRSSEAELRERRRERERESREEREREKEQREKLRIAELKEIKRACKEGLRF